jgi:aspartyl protease family protein
MVYARFCFLALLALVYGQANAVDKIVVLGLFKDKAIVELDGKRRVLARGKTSPEGATLMSADSDEASIEIDGELRSYTLGTHISASFAPAQARAVVQIWPDTTGMYITNGTINGFSVKFLVDTGATLVAMNKNQANRMGLNYKLEGVEGHASTASGIVRAFYLTLARVQVGDISLTDVDAAVVDSDFPTDVLLGNSFLGKLDLERDATVLKLIQQ